MASVRSQRHNRHIVAVISLIVSSVGGFVASPQHPFSSRRQINAAQSQLAPLNPGATTPRPLPCTYPSAFGCGGWSSSAHVRTGIRQLVSWQWRGRGVFPGSENAHGSESSQPSRGALGAPSFPRMSLQSSANKKHSKVPPSPEDSAAGEKDEGKDGTGLQSPAGKVAPWSLPVSTTIGWKPASSQKLPGDALHAAGNVTAQANGTRTDLNGSKVSRALSRRGPRAKPSPSYAMFLVVSL